MTDPTPALATILVATLMATGPGHAKPDAGEMRETACLIMLEAGALAASDRESCLTEVETYQAGLEGMIQANPAIARQRIDELFASAEMHLQRINSEAFTPIDASTFLDSFDRFGDNDAALGMRRIRLSGMYLILSPVEPDEFFIPSLLLDEGPDHEAFSIDMDAGLGQALDTRVQSICQRIQDIDRGCQGDVYLAEIEDLFGKSIIVAGIDFLPFTEAQVLEVEVPYLTPSGMGGDADLWSYADFIEAYGS